MLDPTGLHTELQSPFEIPIGRISNTQPGGIGTWAKLRIQALTLLFPYETQKFRAWSLPNPRLLWFWTRAIVTGHHFLRHLPRRSMMPPPEPPPHPPQFGHTLPLGSTNDPPRTVCHNSHPWGSPVLLLLWFSKSENSLITSLITKYDDNKNNTFPILSLLQS